MEAPVSAIIKTHIAKARGVGHRMNDRAIATIRREEKMGSICKAGG